MVLVESIQGMNIFNQCGQFFIELRGEKIGPFSSLLDAQSHIKKLSTSVGA